MNKKTKDLKAEIDSKGFAHLWGWTLEMLSPLIEIGYIVIATDDEGFPESIESPGGYIRDYGSFGIYE